MCREQVKPAPPSNCYSWAGRVAASAQQWPWAAADLALCPQWLPGAEAPPEIPSSPTPPRHSSPLTPFHQTLLNIQAPGCWAGLQPGECSQPDPASQGRLLPRGAPSRPGRVCRGMPSAAGLAQQHPAPAPGPHAQMRGSLTEAWKRGEVAGVRGRGLDPWVT